MLSWLKKNPVPCKLWREPREKMRNACMAGFRPTPRNACSCSELLEVNKREWVHHPEHRQRKCAERTFSDHKCHSKKILPIECQPVSGYVLLYKPCFFLLKGQFEFSKKDSWSWLTSQSTMWMCFKNDFYFFSDYKRNTFSM